MSVLNEGASRRKGMGNPHVLHYALIFHSIKGNYKNSNNTENTHGNNILMCVRNNAEDGLNHLRNVGNHSGV